MPKEVHVVNDFSGGVVKGIHPKNLKDNQLQECTNLIASGIGKMSIIPDESHASTSSMNTTLPDGAGKNIHAWSSDMELSIGGQANNMEAPTVAEEFKSMKFQITFYASEISDTSKTLPRVLKMNINDGKAIDNVFVPYEEADNHHSENNLTIKLITNFQGNSTTLSDTITDAQNRVATMMDSIVYNSTTDNANGNSDYQMKWNETTSTSGNTVKVASQKYFVSNGQKFYVNKHANPQGDWGPSSGTGSSIYSISGYLEYRGEPDVSFEGNLVNPNAYLRKLTASTTFAIEGSDGSDDNVPATDSAGNPCWSPFHTFDTDTTNFSVANGFLYIKPLFYKTDGYGAYSYWKFNLQNVAQYETATYSVVVKVYTAYDQSSHTDYTITYTSQIGDNADSVITGLFEQLENKIPETYHIEWERTDFGARLKQHQGTETPYGFSLTTSKTGVTDHSSTISDGQKYQHLVAVGGVQSQAEVYSMENDNWLTYNIDIRTTGATSGNDVKFSFLDAEGYLRASDSTFLSTNKPKWFGYMNVNKTYENSTLTTEAGFFVEDASPTPHGDNSGVVGTNGLANQWTHIADKANSLYVLQADGDADIDVAIPSVNNAVKYMPHPQGIKMWYDWIDGTGSESGVLMKGTWLQNETVEFWWSYVYEGGAISQPRIFKTYHANSDSGGNLPMSTNPGADNCALGIHVAVGRQLLAGDGSRQLNARLTGIEIWGRFTNTDANNLYLMAEIDLNKGWRSFATGDWKVLNAESKSGNVEQYNMLVDGNNQAISACPIFKSPPLFLSFFGKYGISWDKPIGFDSAGTGFKSGVVFNRRAYYGNVKIMGVDGNLHHYPDGIIKSAKGLYDVFSVDSIIEATVNDGDEIVCLKVVGNKLCQFKKFSLTIMGIKTLENGESNEEIERIIHHVGLNNDNQICDTPYGLFWVSRSGVYIYNGEEIQKVTETEDGSIIAKEDWESFFGERTHCGYDAYWNQVHICKESRNNDRTIIFDFNTRAFTESNVLYNSAKKTGFVNDRHGHLLWGEHPASTPSSNLTGNTGSSPANQNNTAITAPPQPGGD